MSNDQHGVTKGGKAILVIEGVVVDRDEAVATSQEGCNEGKKSGAGEVKVRNEAIDHLKAETWDDEEGDVLCRGDELAVRGNDALEGARGGGPDGDDPSATLFCLGDGINGGLRYLCPLGMHRVILQPIGLDGLKGAQSHVQCHGRKLYANGFELRHDPIGEVKPARGCG